MASNSLRYSVLYTAKIGFRGLNETAEADEFLWDRMNQGPIPFVGLFSQSRQISFKILTFYFPHWLT
jgi:hypothetical protein